jgi:hypothetical protein
MLTITRASVRGGVSSEEKLCDVGAGFLTEHLDTKRAGKDQTIYRKVATNRCSQASMKMVSIVASPAAPLRACGSVVKIPDS